MGCGARRASNLRSTQSSIISPLMPPPEVPTQAMTSRSWVSMAKATRTTSPFQQGISKPSEAQRWFDAAAATVPSFDGGNSTHLDQQLSKLVDALMEGVPPAMVRERMADLEARKVALRAELRSTKSPAPRLHPNLAMVYRRRMAELAVALASDDAADARELVWSLVEEIRLIPEGGVLRIEVRGELGAILRAPACFLLLAYNAERPDIFVGAFCIVGCGDRI